MIEIAVGVDSHIDGKQYMHYLIKEVNYKGIWFEKIYNRELILETKYVRIRFYPLSLYDPDYFTGKLFDEVFGLDYTRVRIGNRHRNVNNLKLLDYIIEKENELNEYNICTERYFTNR